jgi:hypothetical protein
MEDVAMKLTSHNANTLSGFEAGRMSNILFCLALTLLTAIAGYGHQAQAECQRRASTLRAVDLMDRPPAYNTKRGWVYGNKTGTIPKGTQILICEVRWRKRNHRRKKPLQMACKSQRSSQA